MTTRPTRSIRLMIAVLIALASVGCASTRTINQVLADPSRYRDRDVQLAGEVTQSVSLLNRGAYRIDDGTGQLWVVSEKGVPRERARVTVKGTVREGFNLGSLGGRINLPMGIGTGLVLIESSHKARN